MSISQNDQKKRAREEATHHLHNSMVNGSKEDLKKDTYYHQARDKYMSHTPDERAKIPVPKEMLEQEYDKKPNGNYTHKKKGSY